MSKQYRTAEQFADIVANCTNGNWKDAAQGCVDGGFYANDLVRMHQEGGVQFDELTDIALLAEMVAELRYKK